MRGRIRGERLNGVGKERALADWVQGGVAPLNGSGRQRDEPFAGSREWLVGWGRREE